MRSPYLVITTILFIMISTCLAQNTPEDYLEVHNQAREEVGVGPLTWNKTLEDYAQNYANGRIKDCKMEHSNGPYGENLAEGYGEMTGSDAVKFWLTEKPNYDPISNSCVNDECGHYTQIVSRNSVYLGCARVNLFGITNSLMAEFKATMMAIEIAYLKGWRDIWIECDSALVVDIFNGKGKIP
ncbi:hypothetical protein Lal_00038851 [Lupinus albus]|nr:hypothetical protein Lal_00038851 [Lupinus albus]